MSPERRSYIANLLLLAGFIGVFTLAWFSQPRVAPINMRLLENAAPIALLSLGMLLALYAGVIDLSVASVYACVGVIISQSGAPTDLWVLASLAFAGLTSALIGAAAWWVGYPTLATVIAYFFFRGLASYVSSGLTDTTSFDRSQILQLLDSQLFTVPVQAIVTVAIAALLGLGFFLTNKGREIRTCGADPVTAATTGINVMRTRLTAHLGVGLLVGMAAVTNISATGTAGPNSGDALVVPMILTLLVANAGLERWMPSPARVLLAALAVSALSRQLLLRGWTINSAEMLIGALIMAIMIGSRFLEGRSQAGQPMMARR